MDRCDQVDQTQEMGTPTPHRGFDPARRFAWWGGRIHAIYTVLVFVMLASIDNAAMALYPVLLRLMAIDFEVSEGKMGLAMGVVILVTALTAVGWGYWGDRSSRKRLLFWGTLIWSGGLAMAGLSSSFGEFIAWTAVFGVGLGSVASIGFSVISDFISPRRRGLAMSFWGLSQGVGGILGLVSAALLGNEFWRLPFYFLATAGVAMAKK
jgi:MFS family permease